MEGAALQQLSRMPGMDAQPLTISLHQESGGYEISPDRVPMTVLRTFVQNVEDLLRGDGGQVHPGALDVSIVKGSLAIRTAPVAYPGLLSDLARLTTSELLDGLDKKRGAVIARWQKRAKGTRGCVFRIAAPGVPQLVRISAATNFHCADVHQWVQVERYWSGEIVKMGGSHKVRADIRLEDGSLISLESKREVFRGDTRNRLYKPALVRVSAEYNLTTGAYRNARLIGFEEQQRTLDGEQLLRLTESGASAWRDVPSASAWVDSLRGGAV